jgi:hypothetical protein
MRGVAGGLFYETTAALDLTPQDLDLTPQDIDVSVGRVRYARNEDIRLGYRAWGDGEPALVWVPDWVSDADLYDVATSRVQPLPSSA